VPNRTPSRLVAALALFISPVLAGAGASAQAPAQARAEFPAPLPPGAVAPASTLHDGLQAARADRTGSPEATRAFQTLAAKFGTPLYVYDKASIVGQARALKAAFAPRFPKLKIFYAVKANTNGTIVSLLRNEGLGAEVVSGGELVAARRIGMPGNEIMFTSSSKRPEEIELAIRNDSVLNVDSRDELEQVSLIAGRVGKTARISFRINPGVDPHTIHQINTGISESKFGLHLENGIALAGYARAKELPHVKITGIHCHIGSQITETSGYEATAKKMLAFVRELKEKLGVKVEFLDLGGGLGIPYHDGETVMGPEDLAKALKPIWDEGVKALGYEPVLWLEPGRFFVAPSGFLLARVNSVKTTPVKTFVNVDAGFETLMRPAMYQAYHRVRVIGRAGEVEKLDIAGDVCETGDILAADRMLPRPKAGDLVVILDAGAYGFSMASEYNARPLPAEVLVDGDDARVIRRRGTVDDLFRGEVRVTSKAR
jgi:diaminopimelate decarboxylase